MARRNPGINCRQARERQELPGAGAANDGGQFAGETNVARVLTEEALKDWAASRSVQVPLLGIRTSVDDAPVLGMATLLVLAFWLARRDDQRQRLTHLRRIASIDCASQPGRRSARDTLYAAFETIGLYKLPRVSSLPGLVTVGKDSLIEPVKSFGQAISSHWDRTRTQGASWKQISKG